MLVLSRKLNEKIVIDGGIVVTVVKIDRNQVRLGIEAPGNVRIFREEIAAAPTAHEAAGATGRSRCLSTRWARRVPRGREVRERGHDEGSSSTTWAMSSRLAGVFHSDFTPPRDAAALP